ncbi:hypothetical protein LZ31DRAFT_202575 [Colletotrichum somersetense]|nr:hypothetical protein LZ31DRAFT_202575 [Colletotrichum somersetense]
MRVGKERSKSPSPSCDGAARPPRRAKVGRGSASRLDAAQAGKHGSGPLLSVSITGRHAKGPSAVSSGVGRKRADGQFQWTKGRWFDAASLEECHGNMRQLPRAASGCEVLIARQHCVVVCELSCRRPEGVSRLMKLPVGGSSVCSMALLNLWSTEDQRNHPTAAGHASRAIGDRRGAVRVGS